MRVYLDNASTTPLLPEVFEAMEPYYKTHFGNPSSIHAHGREARSAVEKSRRKIADLLNASASEIFFTSGGTEADNTVINGAVSSLAIRNIITTRIEHPAVLNTIKSLEDDSKVKVHFIDLDPKGHVKLDHLEELLKNNTKALVSLMHANNEIGNLIDLEKVATLCKEHNAFFHSDTVQTVGHYKHDLQTIQVNAIAGSAHKIHGPKGVGFMYLNSETKITPFIYGGSQERNLRAGTENVAGIVGLATALEVGYRDMESDRKHIENLKTQMIRGLEKHIEGIEFNGDSANMESSNYRVLNTSLPESSENEMLLFNLDISGVSASGGSACASGSNIGSHVLTALGVNPARGAIRFSFSKLNKEEEVDFAVEKLAGLFVTS